MKRNKRQKTVQNTLSQIDGVLAALNSYPNLEDALLEKAQDYAGRVLGKYVPTQLDFSKDILEHIVGNNKLIEIISGFLTFALPEVEIALKAALLANMQNLGTNCTIDPFIREKAIKEGIIFDLKQIDLIDKLSISPLDEKIGQYYYFGTENCASAYDILQSAISVSEQTNDTKESVSYMSRTLNSSVGHYFGAPKRDFDCLLWYMKNKSTYRQVWGKRTTQDEDIFNGNGNVSGWLKEKGNKRSKYYSIDNSSISLWEYNNEWSESKEKGKILQMEENKAYKFTEKKITYVYYYGSPTIKKISRKKYYYSTAHGIFYYDGSKWTITALPKNNYNAMEDLPTDIKINDFVMVDKSIYKIISQPKISERTVDNKTIEYISNVKSEECIDITNDLLNNTCIFVDYDLDDNSNKIKEGKTVVSSFDGIVISDSTKIVENKGNKQWKKIKKDDYTSTDEILECVKNNAYYLNDIDNILIPPYDEDNKPYINVNDNSEKDNKYTKKFGVLTLDFSPRTGNVLQSDGNPMKQQTPYDNVLHVFFGNVKELTTSEIKSLQNEEKDLANGYKIILKIEEYYSLITDYLNQILEEKKKQYKKTSERDIGFNIYEIQEIISSLQQYYGESNSILVSQDCEAYTDNNKLINNLSEIETILESYYNYLSYNGVSLDYFNNNYTQRLDDILKEQSIMAYVNYLPARIETNQTLLYFNRADLKYPEAKKNYYFRKTLFEFNTDYINSLQLFDAKVLTAQLITSLCGGATISAMIGATSSWKTELIHDVVKNMVEKTIASEDFSVSDCFFTFTNDTYNGMLRAAELRQAGLYSKNGEENGNNTIDPLKLLEGLNNIDSAADQSEQTTIIEGTLLNASVEISKDIYKENNSLAINSNFSIQTSFIQTLLVNLCTQLVMAMLSPKVYLLILINLEMFGLSTTFDIKSFIERFENLIRSLVKSVVDKFMEYLKDEIMKLVEDLVQKLIVKINFEQVEMYSRLLKQILMHLRMLLGKFKGQTVGWTQDTIGFADIESVDNQEPINEC